MKLNVVTFKLVGYDKRKLNNMSVNKKHESVPENLNYMLPNQVKHLFRFRDLRKNAHNFICLSKLATLSADRLVFGNVPLFSRERKLVFVKNNSYEHKISFTWHVTNAEHIRVRKFVYSALKKSNDYRFIFLFF